MNNKSQEIEKKEKKEWLLKVTQKNGHTFEAMFTADEMVVLFENELEFEIIESQTS